MIMAFSTRSSGSSILAFTKVNDVYHICKLVILHYEIHIKGILQERQVDVCNTY